jgi:hypothetical protein
MRWHLAGSTAHHHRVYTTILYAKNDFGTASARRVIFNQELTNPLVPPCRAGKTAARSLWNRHLVTNN